MNPESCRIVNAEPYTLFLAIFSSLQLTWVLMLLFVQFVQVMRGMTTYENMYGVADLSSSSSIGSSVTANGMPLDPNHPNFDVANSAPGHGHGHGHSHTSALRTWTRLLGVEPFIETVRGTGAATKKSQRRRNPYSRGCMANCRDFWCDPAPMFGTRDHGSALLGGEPVNYMDMYESPTMAGLTSARRRGGYEEVAGEEV